MPTDSVEAVIEAMQGTIVRGKRVAVRRYTDEPQAPGRRSHDAGPRRGGTRPDRPGPKSDRKR